MAEFTAFRARLVTMFVKANVWTTVYHHISLNDLIAARERLRAYVDADPILTQAYCRTVVSHTFDDLLWDVEFTAAFDTDVQGAIPSVVALQEAYFGVEWFFHTDPILHLVCWYTGFNVGDHDQ